MYETLRNYQSYCHNYNKQDSALKGDKMCEPRIFILQKVKVKYIEREMGGGGGGGKEKHLERERNC